MIYESNIRLGDEVEDTVVGLKGIVTGIAFWQHGCVRVAIQAKIKSDGTVPDALWADEPQIKVLKATKKKKAKPKHGPRQDPQR